LREYGELPKKTEPYKQAYRKGGAWKTFVAEMRETRKTFVTEMREAWKTFVAELKQALKQDSKK
jgi:recombinational DNA repair protein RecT